jgi:hypothetical protein
LTGRLASRYSATGQTNRRIETEPIRRRTQRAFLKSRDSTKVFRRSDFRNARSVRKEKSAWQNSHRGHESNAGEMHPIQTVRKTKMGTLAMRRSKKPYVHATMKNEALLDA